MSNSIMEDFVKEYEDLNPSNKMLPLFHSCSGYKAVKIMTDKELKTN